MSPGSQIRALTANKAMPKSRTIRTGNNVERRKLKIKFGFYSFCFNVRKKAPQNTKKFFLRKFLFIRTKQKEKIIRAIHPPLSWCNKKAPVAKRPPNKTPVLKRKREKRLYKESTG